MARTFPFLLLVVLAGCSGGRFDPTDQLVESLQSEDPNERITAALECSQYQVLPEEAAAALVAALADQDPKVRGAAAYALGELGSEGVPYLSEMAKAYERENDRSVLAALQEALDKINESQMRGS